MHFKHTNRSEKWWQSRVDSLILIVLNFCFPNNYIHAQVACLLVSLHPLIISCLFTFHLLLFLFLRYFLQLFLSVAYVRLTLKILENHFFIEFDIRRNRKFLTFQIITLISNFYIAPRHHFFTCFLISTWFNTMFNFVHKQMMFYK